MPEKSLSSTARSGPSGEPATARELDSAVGEINKIIDTPAVLNGEVLRGDTRLTQRWSHGGLHEFLPAMTGHVVMTFYGAAQEISWRTGGSRIQSRTRRGSITLIPEGHDGRWDIGGELEVSHVYLTDERLQNMAQMLGNSRRVELVGRAGFDEMAVSHILEMLSQPSVTADTASRLFVEQAIDLLCTQLIRAHSSIGTLRPEAPRRGLADWQVKRVTGYMRDFLDREIGLEELARLVGLSQFHFCTAFRLAVGATPHQHLTALRMARARELLAEPDLSIIQVALAVGYQTPSAFTASFRKATQVTPSEFRRTL